MSGENDDYSRDTFLEESASESRSVQEDRIPSPPFEVEDEANKESFVSAVENFAEVSSPPPSYDDDHDGGGVVVTCMSTIEEESKSYFDSSTAPSISRSHTRVVEERQEQVASREPVDFIKFSDVTGAELEHQDLNASCELREFHQLINETEAGLSEPINANDSILYTSGVEENVNADTTKAPQQQSSYITSTDVPHDPQHLESVMMKLQELQNTQDILERVLNTDISVDAEQLEALIYQIPFVDSPTRNLLRDGCDDHSERSVSAEIASIQKLIDGSGFEIIDASNSQMSEVAGGNNLLSPSEALEPGMNSQASLSKDRDVDDVLREYEELERSISSASVIDDSFKSEISCMPPPLVTYSKNREVISNSVPTSVPSIKPPLLKSVVPPPLVTKEYEMPRTTQSQNATLMSSSNPSPYATVNVRESNSARTRTRPIANPVNKVSDMKPKSSRVESTKSQPMSNSARSSTSGQSSRNNTQDAYKPRNRRMRSPRTIVSSAQQMHLPVNETVAETQRNTGAGESYSQQQVMTNAVQRPGPVHQRDITERTDYAVAEALKTIQKLSIMVERQETLLEAYSKDNDKLWTQLKEAKSESLEKESNFQDVINSLRTEVATMKLNRLVTSSTPSRSNSNTQTQGVVASPSPLVYNKAEMERLKEDVESKSQQLKELRKEILVLQTKLSEKQSKTAVAKPPAATGASALVFHEKEKEYQKELAALKKQVRTLQKILYSKEPTAPPGHQPSGDRAASKPLQRARSDVSKQNANSNPHQNLIRSIRNTGVDASSVFPRRPGSSPMKGVNINTSDIIQASFNCLDQEREEFEKIIEDKNKLILDKEKTIMNLREQVETLKGQIPDGDVVEPGLVDELRSRIITQNKAIQTLKEHLSTFKKLEAENLLLREDKSILEHQVQEVRRKLEFTQHLVKPENEVLCLLSEKVDDLNSRYHHRERQLDTLLSKLTLKTTTGGGCGGIGLTSSSSSSSISGHIITNLSPRRMPLDQFNNNNGSRGAPLTIGKTRPSTFISPDMLHMADYSPSNSFQLFNSVSDLPDM